MKALELIGPATLNEFDPIFEPPDRVSKDLPMPMKYGRDRVVFNIK